MTGYNTFGEPVEAADADGNVTTTAYDADGRPIAATSPPYTPPGGSPITATSRQDLRHAWARSPPRPTRSATRPATPTTSSATWPP